MLHKVNRPWIKDLDFARPYVWVATWFGCGFLVPASGTWGTLGALPVGILFLKLGGAPFLFIVTLLLIPAGLWASRLFHEATGTKDSSAVVIDEAAGMWVALLITGMDPYKVAVAFALFRLFDIWKPWPISWLDSKLPGEWGVMADDLLAGIYAAAGVYLLDAYIGFN